VDTTSVTEGPVSFRVGDAEVAKGPSTAGAGFYNPAMALTRDVSVLAARAIDHHRPEFLDGMTGAGARGLRVAAQAPSWNVTLNDKARGTAKLARANADEVDARVRVRAEDVNALCASHRFAFVEIDPFGSPVPYLDMALKSVRAGGVVALTATDTSALVGSKLKPCRRRYLAKPPDRCVPGWRQAAIRLLAGYVVRAAARFDREARPLLAYRHDHVYRLVVQIEDGARDADRAIERVREVALCNDCYRVGDGACPCGEASPTGPYWMRPVQDRDFVDALQSEAERAAVGDLAEPDAVETLLNKLAVEAEARPWYLNVDEACKALEVSPPPRAEIVEALAAAGIEAETSQYGPNVLVYDGDHGAVVDVFEDLVADR
jgi:tRNA (guanine26-N2/guanine27-N2)-dimethyltransferase